ncbi:MAG: hypothetical protein CW338_00655 [Clostridiales bacterium]|nr:hypothetical protein [Clostridiales bacterium]
MLKRIPENEAGRYIDPAYELALDQTRSAYPTYADGIKTKDEFAASFLEAAGGENDELLLFEQDGKTAGFIQFYTIPEEHYLQLVMFSISGDTGRAFDELTELLEREYPAYDLYFGFPACNRDAVACLENAKNGFERLEASFNDCILLPGLERTPPDGHVIPVDRQNFDLFRKLHTWTEEEMYWTAERILEAFEQWTVFVYMKDGGPAAAIYCTPDGNGGSEIFGTDFRKGRYDREVFCALLRAVMNDCMERDMKHIVFFAEPEEQEAALDCGFRCVGEYVCYKRSAAGSAGA